MNKKILISLLMMMAMIVSVTAYLPLSGEIYYKLNQSLSDFYFDNDLQEVGNLVYVETPDDYGLQGTNNGSNYACISYDNSPESMLVGSASDFSLTASVNCSSAPAGAIYVAVRRNDVEIGNGAEGYGIRIDPDGKARCDFYGLSVDVAVKSSANICDSSYHTISCVKNGAEKLIVVDGVNQSLSTTYVGSLTPKPSSFTFFGWEVVEYNCSSVLWGFASENVTVDWLHYSNFSINSTDQQNLDNCTYVTCGGACDERWRQADSDCLTDNTQLIEYYDLNGCNTTANLPADNGTYAVCDYCLPIFNATDSICHPDNSAERIYTLSNNATCCGLTNLSSDCEVPNSKFILCGFKGGEQFFNMNQTVSNTYDGKNLTIVGNLTFVPTPTGYGLQADGTGNNYVCIANDDTPESMVVGTGDFSLTASVNCSSAPAGAIYVAVRRNDVEIGNGAEGYGIRIDPDGKARCDFYGLITDIAVKSSANICDSSYHTISCVKNGADKYMILDNVNQTVNIVDVGSMSPKPSSFTLFGFEIIDSDCSSTLAGVPTSSVTLDWWHFANFTINETGQDNLENCSFTECPAPCIEIWRPEYGDCQIDNTKLLIYADAKDCGTTTLLPANNGTSIYCDYCQPDYTLVNNSCGNETYKTYDWNNYDECCAVTGLFDDCDIPVNESCEDPCGQTTITSEGAGASEKWVYGNDCITLKMRKVYNPNIEVNSSYLTKDFKLLLHGIEEREVGSSKKRNNIFNKKDFTSDISNGYLLYTSQDVDIGYKIVGSEFKTVMFIRDYYYYFTDSELWLKVLYQLGASDSIVYTNPIVDGDTIPVEIEYQSEGDSTFVLQNLGRGLEIYVDPIFIPCVEDWQAVYGACQTNDSQLLTYEDNNMCNTTGDLPVANGTYVGCDFCEAEYVSVHGVCNENFRTTATYPISNNATCCALTNLSSDCDSRPSREVGCVGIHDSSDVSGTVVDFLVEGGIVLVALAGMIALGGLFLYFKGKVF